MHFEPKLIQTDQGPKWGVWFVEEERYILCPETGYPLIAKTREGASELAQHLQTFVPLRGDPDLNNL